MSYADGQCDKEPVFSWEDYIDPITNDKVGKNGNAISLPIRRPHY